MYAMSAITSSVFQTMMFPHEDHIITVDQLTHNEKWPLKNIIVIIPYVGIYVEMLDSLLDGKQFGCCNINNLIYLIVVESRNFKANDGFV